MEAGEKWLQPGLGRAVHSLDDPCLEAFVSPNLGSPETGLPKLK